MVEAVNVAMDECGSGDGNSCVMAMVAVLVFQKKSSEAV